MERSNIACQHWQSRRDEGGAESKSHQKDTDGRKRRAPAETRRRGGGKRENPVGAHRRGARLSARQRRQITSTDAPAMRPNGFFRIKAFYFYPSICQVDFHD